MVVRRFSQGAFKDTNSCQVEEDVRQFNRSEYMEDRLKTVGLLPSLVEDP